MSKQEVILARNSHILPIIKWILHVCVLFVSQSIFSIGNVDNYIENTACKYNLKLLLVLEDFIGCVPINEKMIFFTDGKQLLIKKDGVDTIISLQNELDEEIAGYSPQYYDEKEGNLYVYIGAGSIEALNSYYYIYNYFSKTWNHVSIMDNIRRNYQAVLPSGTIVYIDSKEKAIFVINLHTGNRIRYDYGVLDSFFPFSIRNYIESVDSDTVLFQKAAYENNSDDYYIFFNVRTKQFNGYSLPNGNYNQFIKINEDVFYCIEDYQLLGGGQKKSRIVKVNIKTNIIDVIALSDFDREIYSFRRIGNGLYSFIVNTGDVEFGASGRNSGPYACFSIRLPE